MSIRIIEPIAGGRQVKVWWMDVPAPKDAERVAKDLSRDLQRCVDLYDRAGRYIKHVGGVK